jgi:hypothetical protein
MKIGRWIVLALLLAGVVMWYRRHLTGKPASRTENSQTKEERVEGAPYPDSALEVRAPEGVRIRVEVLNTTEVTGLAQRAARFLRDRGFDVVAIDHAEAYQLKTIVLDRTNHPEWARLVAKAMLGTYQSRPDTSLYLDVTVLIGRDWRPPPMPFNP